MSLQSKLEEKVKEINGGGNGESFGEDEKQELVPAVDASDGKIQPVSVVPEFALSMQEAKKRLNMLESFVQEYLIHGADYGLVPGTQKPTLFKSGAEKLCDVYGFSKFMEVTNRVEDWEKGIFAYEIKATIISKRSGNVEAEGVGAANSRERKFIKQDGFSIQNTIIKMAKKRALVDAVLSATRSSGLFSQDLEDLETANPQKQQQPNSNESSTHKSQTSTEHGPITEDQIKEIYTLAKELKLNGGAGQKIIMNHYQKSELQQLTRDEGQDLIQKLQEMKQKH